jgi:Leucine-rich repeat (LRR) protein
MSASQRHDSLEESVRNRTVLIDSAFTKLEKRGVRAEGVPANAERVQAFLDVPTMRIGQARQDVSDRLAGEDPDKFRLLQSLSGKAPLSAASPSRNMHPLPGTLSEFGDGDGFFWDRWLVTNGNKRADTAPASQILHDRLPSFSSPRSGFKAEKEAPRRRAGSSRYARDRNEVEEAIANCQNELEELSAPVLPKIKSPGGETPDEPSEEVVMPKYQKLSDKERAQRVKAERKELSVLWKRKLQYQREKRLTELNPSSVKLEEITSTMSIGGSVGGSARKRLSSDVSAISAEDSKSVATMLSNGEPSATDPANYFGPGARSKFYQQYRQLERVKEKFTVDELLSLKTNGSVNYVPERSAQLELFNSGGDVEDAMTVSTALSSTMQFGGGILGALGPGTETEQAATPRSLYIEELLFGEDDQMTMSKMPQAGLVIRNPTTRKPKEEINLNFQGIGDRMGVALARVLGDLPDLKALSIQDNRLTDESLGPILRACCNCKALKKLDVGGNKMDEDASEAMGELLAHYNCNIEELGMCKADVDDGECAELIEKLGDNISVQSLDLSSNLIGIGEVINIVDPDFDTGGEAIAEMLEKGSNLTYLNLAWNLIRSDSARQLGEALNVNQTLVSLDLSYNAFGDAGGQAIGGALFTNNTLRRLNLSNNAIPCRAAYSLAAGCRHNTSLEDLNLQGNPIGDIGGRALMQVPMDCHDRVAVHLEGCDMTVKDNNFFIDATTQLPREPEAILKYPGDIDNKYTFDLSVPYRRAMALDIFRIVAEEPGFLIEDCKLDGSALTLSREVLKRKHDPNDTVGLLENAVKHVDELWAKYDVDGSGTVDLSELTQLLKDLKLDHSRENVDRVFATYDCDNSGLLEIDELCEFLESAKKDYHERTKPRTVMVESRGKEFIPAHEGSLYLSLGFNPERDIVPRTTTSEELAMLIHQAGKTDDRAGALQLSFGLMRLQVEQAQELIGHLKKDFADIIKVLVMILPYMSSAHHAQVLVTMYLRDDYKERRRLEQELGPAFKPVMGMYTGHYKLDLSKEVHRIALMKLAEVNTLESRKRRHVRDKIANKPKDCSQKGNWYNYRNETLNGKPFQIDPDFFDPLIDHGSVEFDFVSTARPGTSVAVVSSRRFFSLMKKFGFVEGNNDEYSKLSSYLVKIPLPYIMTEEEIFRYDRELGTIRGDDDVPPLPTSPPISPSRSQRSGFTSPTSPKSPKLPISPKAQDVDDVSTGELKNSENLEVPMSPVAAAEDSEPGSGVQSGTLATPHDSRPMTPSHGDAGSGAATPLSPMTPMTPMSPVGLR